MSPREIDVERVPEHEPPVREVEDADVGESAARRVPEQLDPCRVPDGEHPFAQREHDGDRRIWIDRDDAYRREAVPRDIGRGLVVPRSCGAGLRG